MTTYTKLKDGSWGIKGKGLTTGQTVSVTKKSGECNTETVSIQRVCKARDMLKRRCLTVQAADQMLWPLD